MTKIPLFFVLVLTSSNHFYKYNKKCSPKLSKLYVRLRQLVCSRVCSNNDRRRNINAYPNIYFSESISVSKKNLTIWFNHRNGDLENLQVKERIRYCLHPM